MLSFTTLAIATAETEHFSREWQIALMDQFYATISDDAKIKMSRVRRTRYPTREYCTWTGVKCDGDVVSRILYNRRQYGNFDIHVLPPTVESINIEACSQKYPIHTRKLPRKLQVCNLPFNQLFGSVDLRTLPGQLVRLDLQSNVLTGPIELTSLPYNLEYIDLHFNLIIQSVVFYDCLPPNARYVCLMSRRDHTNRIGKVCAVRTDNAVKDKGVFWGISKSNIL